MSSLKLAFQRMGADLVITEESRGRSHFTIDVHETREGERFVIAGRDIAKQDIKILDEEPKNRHLLMMWVERETGTKHKFLCGHDERHWFSAAIPDKPIGAVKNVTDAMEALKPETVRDRERKVGLKGMDKRKRHNPAWKRQGEWFFVPHWTPLSLKRSPILKNEPIQRGRAKPHMCEYMIRNGGKRVWTSRQFPNGLEQKDYEKLLKKDSRAHGYNWTVRIADARVFARGRITHPDHETLHLGKIWHEVLMNRENEAPSMKHMRFLD